MRVNRAAGWLRIGCLVLCGVLAPSAALAQTAAQDLEAILIPGTTVWITDVSGREERTRVMNVAGDVVTTTAGDATRRLRRDEIAQVTVRRPDSVLNGALIGAGAGIAGGLFLCTSMEPWENCRDDIGPIAMFGAIGAGAGILVDALIRKQQTIYGPNARPTRLVVWPLVGPHTKGMRLSVTF
jgi:hypothetical protein